MKRAFLSSTDNDGKVMVVHDVDVKEVKMYDVSEPGIKTLMISFKELNYRLEQVYNNNAVFGSVRSNPCGLTTAREYFRHLLKKAMRHRDGKFLCWADPLTGEGMVSQ